MEESWNELNITQEVVQIIPKTNYLSATELTTLRNNEVPSVTAGLKRTKVENTTEEKNELERLYEHLERQLFRPRIERLAGRALGVWDSAKNLVRVERKDGKFCNFGFSIEGQLYLEFYEALFLLEVNRLQLEYNTTIMSIEQAYLLLLGEQQSPKFLEYLVYSNLTRVGYILVRHQNINFQKHQIISEADCVWAILEAELEDEAVADHVKKLPFYAKVKQRFDNIKHKIKTQMEAEETRSEMETVNNFVFSKKIKPNLKRKANEENQNEWLKAKRQCNYVTRGFQHSLVDFLKEEDEYKQFKETFEKFDLVRLKLNTHQTNEDEKEPTSDNEAEMENENEQDNSVLKLHINFDVYLHNEGFRKSTPHLPNFRVIILQPGQKFPTHDEIFVTHRQQLNAVPLIVVSVNDSKQMQAFLYYFS